MGRLQNEPLANMVEALSQSLAVHFELHISCARKYRNAAAHLEQQIRAAIAKARQPTEPAALERLEQAAAAGADRRAADLARARNWRTALISGAVLAGAVLLALGGGFEWGRSSANAAVAQTERRLVAAFQDEPDAARAWVMLMEQNDLPQALANCKGASVYADRAGRKVCTMPLYVGPV